MRNILFVFVTISMLWACTKHNNEIKNTKVEIPQIDTVKSANKDYLKQKLKLITDSTTIKVQRIKLEAGIHIKKFYAERNYQPFWTHKNIPNSFSKKYLNLIKNAKYYGLDSNLYYYSKLKALEFALEDTNWQTNRDKLAADYELLTTNSCLRFMSHLQNGVLYPDTIIYGYYVKQYSDSFYVNLTKASKAKDFEKAILDMQPKFGLYKQLQASLKKFIDTAGLSDKRFNLPHYKNDSAKCYEKAKKILKYYGLLKKIPIDYDIHAQFALERIETFGEEYRPFVPSLIEQNNSDTLFIYALKIFQKRHGLGQDGIIGLFTWKALKMSNYDRFIKIAANLERMRWEKDFPQYYVFVNIPSYELRIYRNDTIYRKFRVVTGLPNKATPTLSSQIEYFITYPEWKVPYSISSEEILPKVKKDPTYLARNKYILLSEEREQINAEEVNWEEINASDFKYTIIQEGGGGNALGTIKFIFPNPYSVYIHDTPLKYYFNKDIRAYSHGCMRLQNPVDFGEELLKFDKSKLLDSLPLAMKNKERKYFRLKNKVPLFVRYYTAEGTKDSLLLLYYDIYDKDKIIEKQLKQKFRHRYYN